MSAGLAALLKGAQRAGADELRLVPGRKATSVRDGVESDVGGVCSADVIDELIEPFLTPDARMDLALGCAEWGAEVRGFGAVLVRAELRGGETHVAFFLDGASGRAGSSPPTSPAVVELADADEITELELVPSTSKAAPPAARQPAGSHSVPPVLGFGGSPPALSPLASVPPALGGAPPVLLAVADPGAAPSARTNLAVPPVLAGASLTPGQQQALSKAEKQARAQSAQAATASAESVRRPSPATAVTQPSMQAVSAPATVPTSATAKAASAAARPGAAPSAPGPIAASVASSPTASREIQQLLVATVQARGSDLHLSSGSHPMVRIDGEMRPMTARGQLGAQVIEQLVWPIVPERARADFVRRKDADFAVEVEGYARFRANLFVDCNGMGAVFRVIPNQIAPAERLGLPEEVLRLCQLPKGLVLVTGPTGSGKSTTLASLIDYVNRTRSGHIVTIEDPIEFVFENKKCLVNQREVGTHTHSFRDALRAALREDPDILLVGEMRDLETIEIALETAETGHLVFATLHTSSAPAAVDRIIDQFPAERQNQIRVMLAESLKGVIAQMLCRRTGGGRIAAFEVLFGIPAVAHLIRDRKVFQLPSVMQTGQKIGMRLMNDSLLDLVKRGLVTPDEALSKTQDRAGLLSALKEVKLDG